MKVKLEKNKEYISYLSKDLKIKFYKDPFAVEFFRTGDMITGNKKMNGQGFYINHADDVSRDFLKNIEDYNFQDGILNIYLKSNANSKIKLMVSKKMDSVINFKLQKCKEEDKPKISSFASEWEIKEDDHFYGFGERFGKLDKRGEKVDLWVENGSYPGSTYKPIPFFMTPRGYGIMIDTNSRCICNMGTAEEEKKYSLINMDSQLEFNFIYGPKMKDILDKYLEIVGKPYSPQKYFFGPWKSRDWKIENQDTVYEDLNIQRELDISGTIKLIDAGWETEYHTFKFDENKYPEYKKMIKDADDKGYKIVLWISPWIMKGTEAFQEAKMKGFFIKNKDGSAYVNQLGNSPTLRGSVLDFTNPKVIQWWKNNLREVMELGIVGFKTDFGEQVPGDAVFDNGKSGKEMHNIFPEIYNRITWEVVKEKDGILFARSAWHGSQQYPAIWAGDQSPGFAPWSGLPSVINAGLSAGMSGFPYWASDIGGYFGKPAKEVFVRWAQFGAFSPIMQIHGKGEHDPWNFDSETMIIYKNYAQLHTRLLSYIDKYSKRAAQTGEPIMKALPFAFQDDKNVHQLDWAKRQYLFGEEILVAPFYYGGDFRKVYLPKGKWIDWWTGKEYTGQQLIEYTAPLKIIPLFIKKGSIIPLLPDGIETILPAKSKSINNQADKITYEVYPGNESCKFKDKDATVLIKSNNNTIDISINNKNLKEIEINLINKTDIEIKSFTGCNIIDVGEGLPAVAKIDPDNVTHRGYKINISPQQKEITLKLESEG